MNTLKSVFTLALIVSTLSSYSQIKFEPGYYIDNSGNKVECLIKNQDWENNPIRFIIQNTNEQATREVTIEDSREFGVYGKSRFVRSTVDVDRSSNKVEELSTSRTPEFKRERVFLKVLVEGKVNLYMFRDELIRFYYQIDTMDMQPLVYKKYRYNGAIVENLAYRQMLHSIFLCGKPKGADIDRARYVQQDMTKLFAQYNSCVTLDATLSTKKESRDVFNIWIRPRVTFSSFTASRNGTSPLHFQFSNQVRFSGGIEAEFILPFNKNKWAIILEPTYQSYDASIPSAPIKIDYQALELPVGLRHYFFLNDRSRIMLSSAFQMTLPFNSKVVHFSNVELDIARAGNMAIEAGYVFRNKLSIAYRYQTNKELLGAYSIWKSEYQTMAFVVGYSLF